MLAPADIANTKIRQLWRRRRAMFIPAALLMAAVVLICVFFPSSAGKPVKEVFDGLPHAYEYLEVTSPARVKLHLMAVEPEDIVLRTAGLPLRQIEAYGINGGFFYGEDLLSVAIVNDIPAGGAKGAYGSGWFNAKYARGTLVWDGTLGKLSVQTVSSGDELDVSDRRNYWAQGGISMNLQQEELWPASMADEHLPYADEQRLRSGMVYDSAGKLWLIVTPALCTAEQFRTAVLESVPGEGLEGIFLDGDGSSQMNAAETVLTGDSRPVMQMIAVAGGH